MSGSTSSPTCRRETWTEEHGFAPPRAKFTSRAAWDEVEATRRWWVDQGRPGAGRRRFTLAPDGRRIELA